MRIFDLQEVGNCQEYVIGELFVAYKMVKNDAFISHRFRVVQQRGIHIYIRTHKSLIATGENGTLCVSSKMKREMKRNTSIE